MGRIMGLYSEMRKAVEMAVEDSKELGYDPLDNIDEYRGGVRIVTHRTRDTSRSHNGGEYEYWTMFYPENGGVFVQEDWSAEFDSAKWLGEGQFFHEDKTAWELMKELQVLIRLVAPK